MAQSRYQPALLGGLLIGVLSSLPFVSAANACCCLWVVVGGLLTVYLQQQNQPAPLETSEAVLGGLIAGLIGAVINAIISWALLMWTGPLWQEQVRAVLEQNPDVPPQLRAFVERLVSGRGLAVLQLAVTLPMFAIFSMLGSLLGLALFRKKTPPQTQG